MTSTPTTLSAPSRLDRLWAFLAHDPTNTTLLRDLAAEAMRSGEFAQAVKALDQLKAVQPLDANDTAALVHAMTSLGQAEAACLLGSEAIAAHPDDAALRLETARALLTARRFEEAWSMCPMDSGEPAIEQMAGEVQVQSLWHRGELDAALEASQALVARFPANAKLLALHGALLYDDDRLREAVEAARGALALAPAQAHSAFHVLASERLLAGDLNTAQVLVNDAMQLRTDDGRIWLMQASVNLCQGELDEANQALDRAVALHPGNPGALLTLAWVHICRQAWDEAQAVAEHAIQISPAFAESHGTLAVVQASRGNTEEAARSIRRATLLDKTCLSARYAESILNGSPRESVQAIYADVAKLVKF